MSFHWLSESIISSVSSLTKISVDSAQNFLVLNVKLNCEFCSVPLSKFMIMFSCAINKCMYFL